MLFIGSALNNFINGTTNGDVIYGDGGDDTFRFETGFSHDLIYDFMAGAGSDDPIKLIALG